MGGRRDAPLALADLGLIDEYEFLVQPVLAGHGPTLLAGLRERIQLELGIAMSSGRGRSPCDTGRREFRLDVICPGTLAAPCDETTARGRVAPRWPCPERADISTGTSPRGADSLGRTVCLTRWQAIAGVTGHLRDGGDNVPVKLIRPDGSTRRRQSPDRDPCHREHQTSRNRTQHTESRSGDIPGRWPRRGSSPNYRVVFYPRLALNSGLRPIAPA